MVSLILNHQKKSEKKKKVNEMCVKQDKEPLNKLESASEMTSLKDLGEHQNFSVCLGAVI